MEKPLRARLPYYFMEPWRNRHVGSVCRAHFAATLAKSAQVEMDTGPGNCPDISRLAVELSSPNRKESVDEQLRALVRRTELSAAGFVLVGNRCERLAT